MRIISTDEDTNVMCSIVDRVKTLVVYIDYEDIVASATWDDVVANLVVEMPKVISPMKAQHIESKGGVELQFYKNLPQAFVEVEILSDTSEDSELEDLFDSDNDLNAGGEDVYVDVGGDGFLGRCKTTKGSRLKGQRAVGTPDDEEDGSPDEDAMDMSDEDSATRINLKFTSFKAEDMSNPCFKVGMIFESVGIARK
jgi:hypothetical protein